LEQGAVSLEAERDATAWKVRARESERAREQIACRIRAARRDAYNANLRAEHEEKRGVYISERHGVIIEQLNDRCIKMAKEQNGSLIKS
jgi:hypothetical protein